VSARPFRRAFLAAALLTAGAYAHASVTLRAGVEDLALAADTVVEGVVADHSVAMDAAAGAIWTTWRVSVSSTIAGPAASEVRVRVRGGAIGRTVQETIGAPQLADGERVIVFLGEETAGGREVVGMAQGAFHAERDPRTGAIAWRNSVEGLSLVDAAGRETESGPLALTRAELASRVVAAREARDAQRRAEREAAERRLDAWRRAAERHMRMTRGRPGGPPA
jgi:hypothetical protein